MRTIYDMFADVEGSFVAKVTLAIGVLVLVAALGGCAGDVQRTKGVTVDDALSYTEENHASRRGNRSEHETFVYSKYHRVSNFGNQVWDKMVVMWATDEEGYEDQMDFAVDLWSAAEGFLVDSYRDLATVELIKEGAVSFNETKRILDEDLTSE